MSHGRYRFQRAVLVLAATTAALLAAELICRAWGPALPPDKAFVGHAPFGYATCYPTDGAMPFPVDLRTNAGADLFLSKFPDRPRFEELRRTTPHCILYDRSPTGPRSWIKKGDRDVIAVLGDSFAFGEGVLDDQTFGFRLAQDRSAAVRVYAWSGADLEQIEIQFRTALDEARQLNLHRVIYLFVLNDPLKGDALRDREVQINDFMQVRWSREFLADSNFIDRAIRGVGRRSMLWQRVSRDLVLRWGTNRTIAWYNAVFDERQNARLDETFDRIGRMADLARRNDLQFVLAIYPLMAQLENYPFRSIHATIRRLANARGVAVLDLLPAFAGRTTRQLIVHPADYHPNAEAQRIAADATAAALDR